MLTKLDEHSLSNKVYFELHFQFQIDCFMYGQTADLMSNDETLERASSSNGQNSSSHCIIVWIISTIIFRRQVQNEALATQKRHESHIWNICNYSKNITDI